MVACTEAIIRAACRGDTTITPDQLKAGLDALAGKSALMAATPEPLSAVLSREDVAKLLHRTVKAVDVLCRRGALVRHYTRYADGTRARRALGITEASYRRFVEGGGDPVARGATC